MSRSKRIGTAWESCVVEFLRANGVVHAERRTLNGAKDRGDIAGIPGLVIECKNERTTTLASYLDEAERERINDGARIGLAWFKRRGKTSPGSGYVLMNGDTLIRLLADAGYIQVPTAAPATAPFGTRPVDEVETVALPEWLVA